MFIDELYHTLDSVFGLLLWPFIVTARSLFKNPATTFWYLAGTYLAYVTFSAMPTNPSLIFLFSTWVIVGALVGYWVAREKEKGTLSLIVSVFFSGFLLYLPIKALLDYLNQWLLS